MDSKQASHRSRMGGRDRGPFPTLHAQNGGVGFAASHDGSTPARTDLDRCRWWLAMKESWELLIEQAERGAERRMREDDDCDRGGAFDAHVPAVVQQCAAPQVPSHRSDQQSDPQPRGMIVVLAGVCLRGGTLGNDVLVVGWLPGAASPHIQRGDVVLRVAVDDRSGGEVEYDVSGVRLEQWPAQVLEAARESNASFRLLTLRRAMGQRERMMQVTISRVDLQTLQKNATADDSRDQARADVSAAARDGDTDLLRLLLQATCSCKEAFDVMSAHGFEHAPLLLAAGRGHDDCVRCLLEFGANVATTTADGKSALYLAALEGHLGVVYTLRAAGAAVEAPDAYGFRAVHGAALSGHAACLDALLKMGADVDAQTRDGKTAAYLAAMKGNVSCLHVLSRWQADLARGDDVLGFRPLQAAVLHGHLNAALFLSERGRPENGAGGVGMDRRSAGVFAAMIGQLDHAGASHQHSMDADECGGCGGRMGDGSPRNLAMGRPLDVPQRLLRDIGIGYLATCYLATTLLRNTPRADPAVCEDADTLPRARFTDYTNAL